MGDIIGSWAPAGMVLPAELAACRERWSLQDLPLLPYQFDLSPVDRSKQQLSVLLNLLKRGDIAGVVNACDAGREGELIFHYIVRYVQCRKPVERLWLQSMTASAIKESFGKLRPGASMQPLVDAALSRSESDWFGRHQRQPRPHAHQPGRQTDPSRPRPNANARHGRGTRSRNREVRAQGLLASEGHIQPQGRDL